MAKTIKPPGQIDYTGKAVFLAGSIEQGRAEDWQQKVERALEDKEVTFLNPRRESWDSSWEQTISNDVFREQVEWELSGLEKADLIFLYLSPGTQSPISLLELGLFAESGKVIVCCPEGFWRKGNVEIVCARYGIPLFNNFSDALSSLEKQL